MRVTHRGLVMLHEKVREIVDGLCTEIGRVYERAYEEVWTYERFLGWLKGDVWGKSSYQKLPQWAKAEVSGAERLFLSLYMRRLFPTFVLDGRRYLAGVHDVVADGRWSEVESGGQALCYVFGGTQPGYFLIPFYEKDRAGDMDRGILCREVCTIVAREVVQGRAWQYEVGHTLNGKVRLREYRGEFA